MSISKLCIDNLMYHLSGANIVLCAEALYSLSDRELAVFKLLKFRVQKEVEVVRSQINGTLEILLKS